MKKLLLLSVALFPAIAFAHDGHGGGFIAGVNHPVLGLDHFLAMVSVGILSASMGGRAIWTLPATFVLVMLVGGVLSMLGLPMISVEIGIAFSVLALGGALAIGRNVHGLLAMVLVAIFAFFHGHAHGTEIPEMANPALYALGFVFSTVVIHLLGVLIGAAFQKIPKGIALLRVAGLAIAGTGFHFLIS